MGAGKIWSRLATSVRVHRTTGSRNNLHRIQLQLSEGERGKMKWQTWMSLGECMANLEYDFMFPHAITLATNQPRSNAEAWFCLRQYLSSSGGRQITDNHWGKLEHGVRQPHQVAELLTCMAGLDSHVACPQGKRVILRPFAANHAHKFCPHLIGVRQCSHSLETLFRR